MNHADRDRYREELAYFRADLPILSSDKIAARCHTLSLLLTAAVHNGEITTTQIYDKRRRTTSESASHDVPI